MSDFKAKMHRIHFPLLCPTSRWGSLQRSPRPSCIEGPISKGKKRGGEEGGEGKVKRKEGQMMWRGGFGIIRTFGVAPPMV